MPAPYTSVPSSAADLKILAEGVNNAILNNPGNYSQNVQDLGAVLDRRLTDFAAREIKLEEAKTIGDDYKDGQAKLKNALQDTLHSICGTPADLGALNNDYPDWTGSKCAHGIPYEVNNLKVATISGNLRLLNWGKPKTDNGHLPADSYVVKNQATGDVLYAGTQTECEVTVPAGTTLLVVAYNLAGQNASGTGNDVIAV